MGHFLLFLMTLVVISNVALAIPHDLRQLLLEPQIELCWEANRGSAPYLVSLQTSNGYHYCSGALIDQNWVVTVAHCTTGDKPEDVFVLAGLHNISHPEDEFVQKIPVQRIINHELYGSSGYGFDVSLLELAQPAKLGDDIRVNSIRLADTNTTCLSNYGTQIGWDLSKPYLISRDALFVDDETCKQAYPEMIDETMICGVHPGCLCQASASPLECRESVGAPVTLIGLSSWGRGCGLESYPTVYLKIAAVRQWIQSHSGI